MPTFTESDLQFYFPDHWAVRAFDSEPFYKNTSGLGMKGVDFVAIDPLGEGHLFLIEVKNYRTRQHQGGTFAVTLKNADELVIQLVGKYTDSHRLIQTIYRHFSGKWWYKLVVKRIEKSSAYERDVVFWTHVHNLLQHSTRKTFVLWLGLETPNDNYSRYLDQQLAQQLGHDIITEVAPMHMKKLIGVRTEHV